METKIYLTDLSSYNNGKLIGKWVVLPLSNEELSNEIKEVLSMDNDGDIHEEYFITDYEGIARDMFIEGNYYKVDGDIYEVNI